MVPQSNQQALTSEQKQALVRALSEPRFGTYLTAAGHDWDKAWRLYLWNAQLGDAFHLPIQAVEVGIRNCIDNVLVTKFGSEWGTSEVFLSIVDGEQRTDLDVVKRRIRNRDLPLVNGQIVAGLSFGFWTGLLQRRYYPPIWSSSLRIGFPHLPQGRGIKSLSKRCGEILMLRNRISHHEPIIRRDISLDYANIMEMISWICPTTHDLVRPHCRVPSVMREKPK